MPKINAIWMVLLFIFAEITLSCGITYAYGLLNGWEWSAIKLKILGVLGFRFLFLHLPLQLTFSILVRKKPYPWATLPLLDVGLLFLIVLVIHPFGEVMKLFLPLLSPYEFVLTPQFTVLVSASMASAVMFGILKIRVKT